jgi:hypothetical protein
MLKLNRAFLIIVFCLLIASQSISQKVVDKQKNYQVKLSFKTVYDNNVLKNSKKYLDRFKNWEDEGRFHINRYDDLITEYAYDFSFSKNLIQKLNSQFSFSIDHNKYSFNTIKNWTLLTFNLQQFILSGTSLSFSYSYIPKFYVRHYRDDDWIELVGYTPQSFQSFSFSKDEFVFSLQNSDINNLRLRVSMGYARYFHNVHFTEYDCDNLSFSGRTYYSLLPNLKLNAGFKYIKSQGNRITVIESKSSVDPSYNESVFLFGSTYELPKIFKMNNELGFSFQVEKRIYLTKAFYEVDPLHAGRNDSEYRFALNYSLDVLSNLSVIADFIWNRRDSDTSVQENKEFVSNEKDYSQLLFGINVNYKLDF